MHAERVVRAGEYDAAHLVAPGTFVDLVQPDQVVLDDFWQRPFDARARKVNEHVHAAQEPIDNGRITKVAVHDVFAFVQGLERGPAARRAQIDAALLQFDTKNPAHVAARAGERHFGHRIHPL